MEFNTLEKAKELVEILRKLYDDEDVTYTINAKELLYICEDFIYYEKNANEMTNEWESLLNYIRLLEKENKELRGK